jgi:hypothetical protein
MKRLALTDSQFKKVAKILEGKGFEVTAQQVSATQVQEQQQAAQAAQASFRNLIMGGLSSIPTITNQITQIRQSIASAQPMMSQIPGNTLDLNSLVKSLGDAFTAMATVQRQLTEALNKTPQNPSA